MLWRSAFRLWHLAERLKKRWSLLHLPAAERLASGAAVPQVPCAYPTACGSALSKRESVVQCLPSHHMVAPARRAIGGAERREGVRIGDVVVIDVHIDHSIARTHQRKIDPLRE